MSKRVGIFGTSGMALEARDVAVAMGLSVVFVARDQAELLAFGDPGFEVILESEAGGYHDMVYAIGIGEGSVRRKIETRHAGVLNFVNLIHPSASFGYRQREQLEGSRGVIVCAGARFTSNIAVGNFTIFNTNSTVHHGCIIADFVTVSPSATVLGNVEVRSGAWIGAGAVINQGPDDKRRVVGQNTVIGSGAVVLQDCQADSVYVGVPARKIK